MITKDILVQITFSDKKMPISVHGYYLKKFEGFELFDPKFEIIHELKQKQAKKTRILPQNFI